MWTTPSRLMPAERAVVAICYDGCAPTLAMQVGLDWYSCTNSGSITHALERDPDWWAHLPWRVSAVLQIAYSK